MADTKPNKYTTQTVEEEFKIIFVLWPATLCRAMQRRERNEILNACLRVIVAIAPLFLPTVSREDLESDRILAAILRAFIGWEKVVGIHACKQLLHTVLHIEQQVRDLGPFYGHWMLPFERMNHELAKKRNSTISPEANMLKNWILASYSRMGLTDSPELRESVENVFGKEKARRMYLEGVTERREAAFYGNSVPVTLDGDLKKYIEAFLSQNHPGWTLCSTQARAGNRIKYSNMVSLGMECDEIFNATESAL